MGLSTTSADFDAIDRQIEELRERIIGYRKAMALSRATILIAAVAFLLVLTIAGSYRTPTVVFAAVAAMIGGTVWLGASRSSLQEAEEALKALDAVKARMIDVVAMHNGWRDLTPTVH